MKERQEHILLQVCCAPCATHSIKVLQKTYEVTAFFYNPNIEPESEYRKRLEEGIRLGREWNVPVEIGEYDNKAWRGVVKDYSRSPEGGKRCEICYEFRLKKTAMIARLKNCDGFTTTLSISPHKSVDMINRTGFRVAEEAGINFLFMDFKKQDGFRISCQFSKSLNFYRQSYCGCSFSRQ